MTDGTSGKRTAYPSEAPEFSMFFPAAPRHRDIVIVYVSP